MEPLENPATSSYGYSPYPCDLDRIVRELEAMAGTDVNAIVETSFNSHRELLRCNGRLGMAEDVPSLGIKLLRYAVGDGGDSWFEIAEDDFNRGQMVPGMVWFEARSGVVLTIERRFFPPEIEEAD
jgi:hypothetical protein